MDSAARIGAVVQRMTAEGIDLLLVAANGLHTLDLAEPAVHLSGYLSLGESLFLLDQAGAVKLIVSPANDTERLGALQKSFACIATDDPVAALIDLLAGRDAESRAARIATAGFDSLPHTMAERILASASKSVARFDGAFDEVTGPKTSVEVERARRATSIAEQGFRRMIEIASPGMRECDLAVALNSFAKSLGADDNFLMLNASPHNPAVMPSSTRELVPGDILLTEFSPSYQGQFSQICRTCVISQPRAELQEKYDLVVRAMWAGIEVIRPGIPIREVSRAIDGVLSAAGYAEYCKPPHMRRRGHGLGCGSVAPGDVANDNETLLEEDMVFVVHPNQYLPESGYLMCGEPVRVTRTGVETLSTHTAALGVVELGANGSKPCA